VSREARRIVAGSNIVKDTLGGQHTSLLDSWNPADAGAAGVAGVVLPLFGKVPQPLKSAAGGLLGAVTSWVSQHVDPHTGKDSQFRYFCNVGVGWGSTRGDWQDKDPGGAMVFGGLLGIATTLIGC
jgi:hypothetical protein